MLKPADISRSLSGAVTPLVFAPPVAHVYNPLDYARGAHEAYLSRCRDGLDALLLGMNPGPWGMAQTGVPFGDVRMVADWLGIRTGVKTPAAEHPKRPILGFDCDRSEVSGTRLWGWARDRFGDPGRFFDRFFIWNYCPLAFLEVSGRNRTPDKLPTGERTDLFAACDLALSRIVEFTRPRLVVGIGKFAEDRARSVVGERVPVGTILHPSPASPSANRGWAKQAEKQFADMGIRLP